MARTDLWQQLHLLAFFLLLQIDIIIVLQIFFEQTKWRNICLVLTDAEATFAICPATQHILNTS